MCESKTDQTNQQTDQATEVIVHRSAINMWLVRYKDLCILEAQGVHPLRDAFDCDCFAMGQRVAMSEFLITLGQREAVKEVELSTGFRPTPSTPLKR